MEAIFLPLDIVVLYLKKNVISGNRYGKFVARCTSYLVACQVAKLEASNLTYSYSLGLIEADLATARSKLGPGRETLAIAW
jgi:hypothetical protein